MHYRELRSPSPAETRALELATHLACTMRRLSERIISSRVFGDFQARDLVDDCDQSGQLSAGRREVPSLHWLESLDPSAPFGLGHVDVTFGIDRQSVAMGKLTDLVTRAPEA